MLFVVVFQVIFYTETLYNSPEDARHQKLTRADLSWAFFSPGPDNPWRAAFANLRDIHHLADRGLFLAIMVLTVVVALGLGDFFRELSGTIVHSTMERWLVAYALGMGIISLTVQGLGLAGLLWHQMFLIVTAESALAGLFGMVYYWHRPNVAPLGNNMAVGLTPPINQWTRLGIIVGAVPFLGLSLLAALLPTTDYDALAYHLLGPKEWWLAGRIHFLPHNVYTTFPFLTEMFPLLGMALMNDWFLGALVGQALIWTFVPATGLAVGLLGTKLFDERAGWLAGLVFLSTPWAYRLGAIPYVEGALLFYAVMAVYAAIRARAGQPGWTFVTGCLVACAGACKYPGLLMVGVPATMIVFLRWPGRVSTTTLPLANSSSSFQNWRRLLSFILGGMLFLGPWLARNVVWTGNPVYPLAYNIFGGQNWTPVKAEKFAAGHRSTQFDWSTVVEYWADGPKGFSWRLGQIPCRSDWQSALVFGFAPLAIFFTRKHRAALGLWCLLAFHFFVFWGFTHRLDRFWLPLQPFAAVLAGAGLAWSRHLLWRLLSGGGVIWGLLFNLGYCTTPLCGLNTYTAPLRIEPYAGAARVANRLPSTDTVLFVGYAGVFPVIPHALYNTVFDDVLLLPLVFNDQGELLSTETALARLRAEGINWIIVDWDWIRRYREPGNYGYDPAIQPELFARLTAGKVLRLIPLVGSPWDISLYQVINEGETP